MDVAQNCRDGKDDHVENFNHQFMGVKIFWATAKYAQSCLGNNLLCMTIGCIKSASLTYKTWNYESFQDFKAASFRVVPLLCHTRQVLQPRLSKDKWQWYRPTLALRSRATLPCTISEFDCMTLLMLDITKIQLEVHGKKTVSLRHRVIVSSCVIICSTSSGGQCQLLLKVGMFYSEGN